MRWEGVWVQECQLKVKNGGGGKGEKGGYYGTRMSVTSNDGGGGVMVQECQ